MPARLLRSAFISLLAASALTGLVPAAASAAPAAPSGAPECDEPYDTRETVLKVGQRLAPGEKLTNPTGHTELVMQGDGNLVLYALGYPGGPKLPLWNTGTYGNPGAYATMQEDGNFVVYKQGGSAQTGGGIWHTASYGDRTDTNPRAYLEADGDFRVIGRKDEAFMGLHWRALRSEKTTKLCAEDATHQYRYQYSGDWSQSATVWMVVQNDNNLVIYRKRDGQAIWNSGTYGSGFYSIELRMEPDGEMLLRDWFSPYKVVWRSGTAGNPGAYALLQDDGNFVVYKADGGPGKGGALWQSGTYDKV
ncbi:hypothetical protein [Streptomyces sp. WAC06614]|uniref:hypothetical protein n=1 Tax=Streptomyces sp. WAC06614 TaxID=2487416 RepID=UPI000F78C025|nr:hypothetical protein [Streptomyces sp. WAC06614]RSS83828.1 hypothetical protein EF918_02545 [Streptomyces sp. WAC06614]